MVTIRTRTAAGPPFVQGFIWRISALKHMPLRLSRRPLPPRSKAKTVDDKAAVVLFGNALLFVTLCCDALLGNFQEKVMRENGVRHSTFGPGCHDWPVFAHPPMEKPSCRDFHPDTVTLTPTRPR